VRLHPYQTGRVLQASPFLGGLVDVASAHHERMDGSGYHRGATAPALSASARIERPAGLTEREAEVVGMLARGMQTKQVAVALGISVKTADRHIQNAYGKIGVSTRAGATLFAMEHGLVAWADLASLPP